MAMRCSHFGELLLCVCVSACLLRRLFLFILINGSGSIKQHVLLFQILCVLDLVTDDMQFIFILYIFIYILCICSMLHGIAFAFYNNEILIINQQTYWFSIDQVYIIVKHRLLHTNLNLRSNESESAFFFTHISGGFR